MSSTKLGVRLYTRHESLALGDAAEVLAALHKLLRAVTEEVAGKDAAGDIEWSLGAFRYECDGCGTERPAFHDDWRHTDDGHDWCRPCQNSGRAPLWGAATPSSV